MPELAVVIMRRLAAALAILVGSLTVSAQVARRPVLEDVYIEADDRIVSFGNELLRLEFNRATGRCTGVFYDSIPGNLLVASGYTDFYAGGRWMRDHMEAMGNFFVTSDPVHRRGRLSLRVKAGPYWLVTHTELAPHQASIETYCELVSARRDTVRMEGFRFAFPWRLGAASACTLTVPGPFFPTTFVRPATPYDSLAGRTIAFHSAPDAGFGVLALSNATARSGLATWMRTGGEVNYTPRLRGDGAVIVFEHDDLRYYYLKPGDTVRSDAHVVHLGSDLQQLLHRYRADSEASMPMDRRAPSDLGDRVILEVYPDYFPGGFKEIASRLKSYKSIGFNTIYLMPHWKGSYSPVDPFCVEPRYGTTADLQKLVATAHLLGMTVLFDMVIHGFSKTSAVPKQHPAMFVHNPDGSLALHPAWKSISTDWAEASYQNYMTKLVMHDLLTFDIDGYRVDAASYKGPNWDPRVPYPAYKSGAAAPALMGTMLRAMRNKKPGAVFLNEVFGPVFYHVSNFSHDNQTEAVQVLMEKMEKGQYTAYDYREHIRQVYAMLPTGANRVFFARNHDTSWFYHFNGYTPLFFCFEAVHAFFGIPEVFAGDPKYAFNPDDDAFIYEAYRRIFAVRAQHEELRRGAMQFDLIACKDANIFSGVRSLGGESSIVLVNMSDEDRMVDVTWKGDGLVTSMLRFQDVLNSDVIVVPHTGGSMRVSIKAFQVLVGKIR